MAHYFVDLYLVRQGICVNVRRSRPIMCCTGPSRGGKGGSFSGPRDILVPRNHSQILTLGFFLTSNIQKIQFWWPGLRAADPAGGAYDAPQTPSLMVSGHPSRRFFPSLSMPSASRSRRIENEVVIGPRDSGLIPPAPLWLSTGLDV